MHDLRDRSRDCTEGKRKEGGTEAKGRNDTGTEEESISREGREENEAYKRKGTETAS
jgi:hypothetical protein